MAGVELDSNDPLVGYKQRPLYRLRFTIKQISNLRTRETAYGIQEYFLIWPEEDDYVISVPGAYFGTPLNLGDRVEGLVYGDRINMDQTFLNIAGDRTSKKYGLKILSQGDTDLDGPYTDVEITTNYVSNYKYDDYDERRGGHYSAKRIECSLTGVDNARFPAAALRKDDEEDYKSDELQYAMIKCNGVKKRNTFTVETIHEIVRIEFPEEIVMKISELTFNDLGAQYTLVKETPQETIEIKGMIDDDVFPFDCSTFVNKIMEMYPEEFNHYISINATFHRMDRWRKRDGEFKRTVNLRQAEILTLTGLDIPLVVDGMQNVINMVMQEQKYAEAIKALRLLKGNVTYKRAAKTFEDLDLEFTEDEYYQEIESRLLKEHKDYDRAYFDILREKIQKRPSAEWGGNPETGEFVGVFPDEKLIVLELPVPGRATYFYRIHDDMDTDEMLARISLASPQNGVKRSALWSSNSFKEELVDPFLGSIDADRMKIGTDRMNYLNDLTAKGLISSPNENIRSWSGYIGRAIHRSYENFEEKLDEMLDSAPKMTMGESGYEIEEIKKNPIGPIGSMAISLATHLATGPMVGGAVAATTGFFLGKYYEKENMEKVLDFALNDMTAAQRRKAREWEDSGMKFMGIASPSDLKKERVEIIKKGYKPYEIKTKDYYLLYGEKYKDVDAKSRKNPELITKETEKAYEEFHDQPHKNVVKAKIFDKPEECTILGPLKHVVYFCSKWSEDEDGNIINEENVDVHYIHEWNEDGDGTDAGENCMWVAATDDMKNIVFLGDCEVLDVGITDAESPNENPEKLLKEYKPAEEVVWLGELKEIAYIGDDKQKHVIKIDGAELCTDSNLKKLYLVEEA